MYSKTNVSTHVRPYELAYLYFLIAILLRISLGVGLYVDFSHDAASDDISIASVGEFARSTWFFFSFIESLTLGAKLRIQYHRFHYAPFSGLVLIPVEDCCNQFNALWWSLCLFKINFIGNQIYILRSQPEYKCISY